MKFGSALTEIGKYAFEFGGLTSVSIPSGVTAVGGYAFDGCPLTEIKCGASSEPSGWDEYWSWYSDAEIEWGASL